MTREAIVVALCVVFGLAEMNAAVAGECVSRPERFELHSDTVYWAFSIPSGGECLQGLRGKTQLLDDVKLVEPPSGGKVTTSGPSFRYQAPSGPGNDRFRIGVTGENRRVRGASVIIVDVTVR